MQMLDVGLQHKMSRSQHILFSSLCGILPAAFYFSSFTLSTFSRLFSMVFVTKCCHTMSFPLDIKNQQKSCLERVSYFIESGLSSILNNFLFKRLIQFINILKEESDLMHRLEIKFQITLLFHYIFQISNGKYYLILQFAICLLHTVCFSVLCTNIKQIQTACSFTRLEYAQLNFRSILTCYTCNFVNTYFYFGLGVF